MQHGLHNSLCNDTIHKYKREIRAVKILDDRRRVM